MRSALVLSPQCKFWFAGVGFGFAVPQLKAFHKAVALQSDGAAVSASPDHVAYLQNFRLAVAIVDHDAVKLDGRILNADLQEAVTARGLTDFNIVMVVLAVNVGLAKIDPVFRMGRRATYIKTARAKSGIKSFFIRVCSPRRLLKDFSGLRSSWCASANSSSPENGSAPSNPKRKCKLPEFCLPSEPKSAETFEMLGSRK